jgi:hypothetical protein
MNRFLFAGLCALAAGLGGAASARAQCLQCLGGSPYGCGGVCAMIFPCSFKHGPLVNYGDGSGMGGWGAGCGANGCGHGGCGHGGWGPWNRSAGCGDGCGHRLGGHGLLGRHGGGCDACGSDGHYARQTFANVFGRLHPTAHKCGQTCSLDCGSGCSDTGCGGCGGHAHAGWFAHLGGGCGDGCGRGGLLGHHGGCGADGCGLFGHHGGCGGGCGDPGCGGHCLFGIRGNLNLTCSRGIGAGGAFSLCGLGGANYGGYGVQAAGLNKGPWYLYWPTPNNLFQVPGPNAAGWAGNHFVLPAPYGQFAGGGGVNPYFPASAQVPAGLPGAPPVR